jgi:hypothetical protein
MSSDINTGIIFSGIAVPKLVHRYSWWDRGHPVTEEEELELSYDDARYMIKQVEDVANSTRPVFVKTEHQLNHPTVGILKRLYIDGESLRFDYQGTPSPAGYTQQFNVLTGLTNAVSLHSRVPNRMTEEPQNEMERLLCRPMIIELSLCAQGRRPGAVLDMIKDESYKPLQSLSSINPKDNMNPIAEFSGQVDREMGKFNSQQQQQPPQQQQQQVPVSQQQPSEEHDGESKLTFLEALQNMHTSNIPTKSARSKVMQGVIEIAEEKNRAEEAAKRALQETENMQKELEELRATQREASKQNRITQVDTAKGLAMKMNGKIDENLEKICTSFIDGTLNSEQFGREVLIPLCSTAASAFGNSNYSGNRRAYDNTVTPVRNYEDDSSFNAQSARLSAMLSTKRSLAASNYSSRSNYEPQPKRHQYTTNTGILGEMLGLPANVLRQRQDTGYAEQQKIREGIDSVSVLRPGR